MWQINHVAVVSTCVCSLLWLESVVVECLFVSVCEQFLLHTTDNTPDVEKFSEMSAPDCILVLGMCLFFPEIDVQQRTPLRYQKLQSVALR